MRVATEVKWQNLLFYMDFEWRYHKKCQYLLYSFPGLATESLIASISKEMRISKASAEKAINAFTNSVMKALKKGDKVTLTGFGTFSVVKRRARSGRNPQTWKEIKIPAARVAKFKAGNLLKSALR
jgi:DNA-binding protein HU-beta